MIYSFSMCASPTNTSLQSSKGQLLPLGELPRRVHDFDVLAEIGPHSAAAKRPPRPWTFCRKAGFANPNLKGGIHPRLVRRGLPYPSSPNINDLI